jgi:hypothetical protein
VVVGPAPVASVVVKTGTGEAVPWEGSAGVAPVAEAIPGAAPMAVARVASAAVPETHRPVALAAL